MQELLGKRGGRGSNLGCFAADDSGESAEVCSWEVWEGQVEEEDGRAQSLAWAGG